MSDVNRVKDRDSLHVAIIHRTESESIVTCARTRDELVQRLARYVRRNATYLLWPDDAECVDELLAAGDLAGAVDSYFDALGDESRRVRWERQRLIIRRVR